MMAILIFMAALLLFVIALEVDLRRRPRAEHLHVEDDELMAEITQGRFSPDERCACDPLDERGLPRNSDRM